jgi:hypothetical protein
MEAGGVIEAILKRILGSSGASVLVLMHIVNINTKNAKNIWFV